VLPKLQRGDTEREFEVLETGEKKLKTISKKRLFNIIDDNRK